MKSLFFTGLMALLFLFSCSKKDGPELVLNEFIKYRFSGKNTPEKVLSFLSGNLKERVESIDPENKDYFNLSNIRFKSHKVLHKDCRDKTCYLTYLVKYSRVKNKKTTDEIETKKIAEMQMERSEWKISDISDYKAQINSFEVLRPPKK